MTGLFRFEQIATMSREGLHDCRGTREYGKSWLVIGGFRVVLRLFPKKPDLRLRHWRCPRETERATVK